MKYNKIFKKIITCFVLFVTLFAFSGCKKDEDPVLETQEAMFAKYLTAQSNLNNPESGYKAVTSNSVSFFGMKETTTSVSTVNFVTGELAYIKKDSDGNIDEEFYIVKSNNKNIFYHHETFDYDDDTYEAMYVGNDFLFMYDEGELMDAVNVDVATFEEFKSAFSNNILDSMGEDVGVADGVNLNLEKFEFSQDGDNYKFDMVLKISGDGTTVSMTAQIKFTKTYITSLSVSVDMGIMSMSSVTNYYVGYDSALMPASFLNYPSASDIDYAEFTVTYYLDGVTEGVWFNDYYDTYKPGQTFTFDADELEYITLENTTIDGWYLDPECTISVNTLTEYPSYDIELYGKTVPNTGYAVIIYTSSIEEDGWTFHDSNTIVCDVSVTQSINLADLVDDSDATITEIKVNGNKVTNYNLTLTSGGYYIVEISVTIPTTE